MTSLLENGADVRPQNSWNGTALSEARKSFNPQKAVALLLQAGAEE